MVCQATLTDLGCDGADGVAAYSLRAREVAAIITDMTMPVMEGPEAIRILRTMNPTLPIIAMSGLASTTYVPQLANLGVKHILSKPFATLELLKMVKHALAGTGQVAAEPEAPPQNRYSMEAKPTSDDLAQVNAKMVAMNEALILGAVRQHELTDAAERVNAQLKKTARKLAEKARLLDLSKDATIVRDLDGRITSWNKGAENPYGQSDEEVIGKDLHAILQTEFLARADLREDDGYLPALGSPV